MDKQETKLEQNHRDSYFEELKKQIRNSNIIVSSRRSVILSLLLLTLFFASVKVIFSV